MTRSRWVLLLFELFLFALILILPQVDLPDTAFRDGHTPVLAKLQVTSAPIAYSAFAVLNVLVESERSVGRPAYLGLQSGAVPSGEQFSSLYVAVLAVFPPPGVTDA